MVPIPARKPSSLGLAFVVMIPTGALEKIQMALFDKRKFNDKSTTKTKYFFSLGDEFPELQTSLSTSVAIDPAAHEGARYLSLSPEAYFCKALLGIAPLTALPSLLEQSHFLSSVPVFALGKAMKVARSICRDRGGGGGKSLVREGFANLTAGD